MYSVSGDEFAGDLAGWEDDSLSGYDSIVGDARADQLAALLTAAASGDYAASGALPAAAAAARRRRGRPHPAMGFQAQLLREMGALRAALARACGGGLAPAAPIRGGFGSQPMQNVKQIGPAGVSGYPLGFDSVTTFASGSSATVTSQPQTVFRCERLIVPTSIAPSVLIVDVKIGNRSQLNNSTNLPGAVFAENAVGVSLRWDTAQISQVIAITATNTITTAGIRFVAAMLGTAAFVI